MIAMFPTQLQVGADSRGAAKAAPKEKKKGPAKQEPSNPLSGSPEKKAFDAAKKAVAKATKDAGVKELPASDPLVSALLAAKDKYFRSLSVAKGENSSAPKAPKDESAWTDKVGTRSNSYSNEYKSSSRSPPKEEREKGSRSSESSYRSSGKH
jgi:hypothetical protein